MSAQIFQVALSQNPFVSPARYFKILEEFQSIKQFFDLNIDEQMQFLKVNPTEARTFFERMLDNAERVMTVCREKSIQIVPIDSENYPVRLKNIANMPFLLYQLGNYNQSIKTVGIVGTRNISNDAAEINRYFSSELVSYHIGIVSGMAKGHDYISQRTALDLGGYTVAVLGSGIDVIYPTDFEKMYYEIIEKGCVLSEYPPGAIPDKYHFPLRNRIISGLSDAVLVVQAPSRSGALHTAKYAENQGKDLYVIPGNPTDPRYEGSNRLLQNGAKIALKPEDIAIEILGRKVQKTERLEKPAVSMDLSEAEKQIMQNLESETYIDDLSALAGIGIAELNNLLMQMEIKGLVFQYPGRFYVRNGIM